MNETKLPGWIIFVLGVMAFVMFLGTTPALYGEIAQENTSSFVGEIYQQFSFSVAVKQLALVIVIVFSLIKRDIGYVYVICLLLLLLSVFNFAVLVRYGNSFNLWLTVAFVCASGACFFKVRALQAARITTR